MKKTTKLHLTTEIIRQLAVTELRLADGGISLHCSEIGRSVCVQAGCTGGPTCADAALTGAALQ